MATLAKCYWPTKTDVACDGASYRQHGLYSMEIIYAKFTQCYTEWLQLNTNIMGTQKRKTKTMMKLETVDSSKKFDGWTLQHKETNIMIRMQVKEKASRIKKRTTTKHNIDRYTSLWASCRGRSSGERTGGRPSVPNCRWGDERAVSFGYTP